jgi:hypothetical protein
MTNCAWCSDVAVRQSGRLMLCSRHFRFCRMRVDAKRRHLAVPTYGQLNALLSGLGPDMACPTCRCAMTWTRAEGSSRVVTLQHDRSGDVRLMCMGCNIRHWRIPGDEFYEVPVGLRRCPRCAECKPLEAFIPRKRGGIAHSCRDCSKAKYREWCKANREKFNAYHRKYRANRKARAHLEALKAKLRAEGLTAQRGDEPR